MMNASNIMNFPRTWIPGRFLTSKFQFANLVSLFCSGEFGKISELCRDATQLAVACSKVKDEKQLTEVALEAFVPCC